MRWIHDSEFNPRYTFWTRANISEVLPDPPSPLSWDLCWEGAILAGWRDCYVHRFGMEDHEVHRHRVEAIGFFGGYAYLGAALFRVWAGRTPGMKPTAIDEAYFGDHPDVPPYVAEDWHANERTTARMGEWLQWVTGDMNLDDLDQEWDDSLVVRATRPDLASTSDVLLLGRAMGLRPFLRRASCTSTVINVAASVGPGMLGALCAGVGRPEALMNLLSDLGDIDSASPSLRLWELSRAVRESAALSAAFDEGTADLAARLGDDAPSDDLRAFGASFREFIAEFGSRGPNEWDLAAPVWEVNPAAALAAVERMRLMPDEASPAARLGSGEAERNRTREEMRALLAGDAEAAATFELGLRASATFISARERSKTLLMRVLHEMRMAVTELGRRFHERGQLDDPADVLLLFTDELEDLVVGALPDAAALTRERRAYRAWLSELEPPFIISGEAPPNTTWPRRQATAVSRAAAGDTLVGVPGAPGVAVGRARVLTSSTDPLALEPGEVLVAPATDPSWTPLFIPAAAVVVEVGAMLSHAVIVSRELGIPCAPSVLDATSRIPDGALVRVDGDRGTVTVLELP